MPFAKSLHPVEGAKLNLLSRQGEGAETVIFLHGFPTNASTWSSLMERLPGKLNCHALDLRGFGDSSASAAEEGYRMAQGVRDVAGVIEAVTPDGQAHLVGHDVGGMLAYSVAAERPELVKKLVVINGVHPGAFRHGLLTDRAQIMASAYLDLLAHPNAAHILSARDFRLLRGTFRRMLNGAAVPPGTEERLVQSWSRPTAVDSMLGWYRNNFFYRTDPEALVSPRAVSAAAAQKQRITQPHLLLWGTPDPFLLPVNKESAAAFCDRIETAQLPGAGHAPHLTRPDDVAGRIAEFLRL